jgi:hypothetical protein
MRFCFTVLREEIETALRLLGVNSIAELSPKHVLLPFSQYLKCPEAYDMSRLTRGRWRRSYMLAGQIRTSRQNYEGIPGTRPL